MSRPPAGGAAPLATRVRHEMLSGPEAGTAALAAAVRRSSGPIGGASMLSAVELARRELLGVGALEPLLADERVTDVLVNGPREVWVERSGRLERTDVDLGDEDAVRRLAVRLAATAGRRLDTASPFVDVRLPDGSRLHAVLPPVSPAGTLLSIRVLRHRTLGLDDLERLGSVTAPVARLLRDLVAARLSVLVTGGTGTGKTTLLGAMLDVVADAERIVLVEDAGELRSRHPHVVRLEARTANVEGSGQVTLRDLVRQALRMRPDRLVVGEARGPEIVDLLTALNVGSEGGMTTLHANSAGDVPARLAALSALAGLAPGALEPLARAGLHAVVHLRRLPSRQRQVAEVAVVAPQWDGQPPVTGPAGGLRVIPAVGVDGRTGPGACHLGHLLADRGVTWNAGADSRGPA